MNEWVIEYKRGDCDDKWVVSEYYKYAPGEGIIGISRYAKEWSKLNGKSNYRLIHKPTGKVIPGELL